MTLSEAIDEVLAWGAETASPESAAHLRAAKEWILAAEKHAGTALRRASLIEWEAAETDELTAFRAYRSAVTQEDAK